MDKQYLRHFFSFLFVVQVSMSIASGLDDPKSDNEFGDSSAKSSFSEKYSLSLEQRVLDANIPGIAISVVRADGSYWAAGYGYADLARRVPMTKDTVMSIASVSKTITGTAIIQLVENGKLDLDSSIDGYLPFKVINPNRADDKITLRHILTHTSGIVDNDAIYASEIVYHFGGDNPVSLEQFLEAYLIPGGQYYSAKNNFLSTQPGKRFEYGNIAYGLAGLVVESVSEQSFSDFTRQNILEPLEMNSSGWLYPEVKHLQIGKQYGREDGDYRDNMVGDSIQGWRAYDRYGLATYPDGGFRTSVSDLSHFLAAIMNGGSYKGARILEQSVVDEMLMPQEFYGGRPPGFYDEYNGGSQALAFAHQVIESNGLHFTTIGHTGGDPGTITFMGFDPERKIGVIIFINSDETKQSDDLYESLIGELFSNHDKFLSKN
ncbi:MAG: CubicO group peptidase (beta-lactamase class C family) [Pseudohongiellaceae bacterium]|jgi:CubicO group peptidase (beta-lactamase class C family)